MNGYEYYDYLDHHQYIKPHLYDFAPREMETRLLALGRLIGESKNPNVKIFLGEWNLQSIDWRTGLFAGGALNVFERTPCVAMATPALFLRHVSASGWNNAFVNFDQSRWFPAPNYVVMRLWHDHYQPKLLALEGSARPLIATATLSEDGKRLVLKAVNPTYNPIDLALNVTPGFPVRQAKLLLIAPGSLDACNTLTEPNKVKPMPGEAACSGQTVRCRLPALSASVLVAGQTSAEHPD